MSNYLTKLKQIVFYGCLTLFFCSYSYGGKYADIVGAYLANKGVCKTSYFMGKHEQDRLLEGVCIPIKSVLDESKKELIPLAIIELKSPNQLKFYESIEKKKRDNTEAFHVEVDSFNDNIFKLVDGSILEKDDHKYVGYISYHEKGIFYKDGSKWKLCVNNKTFKVKLLKNNKYHYSRDEISDISIYEIEKLEECS
ncbi:hypothetical protein [Kangiella profundi]|nr:hypothetical protein [Kangiella profundi]